MKINKENAEHYIWKDVCDGWFLVNDDEKSIIEERMPPNTKEDMHYHKKSRQFFYIIRGKALMKLDNEDIDMEEGDGIAIEPYKWHQMTNPFEKDVKFIVFSSPKSHGDKFLN
ncbi:cupin domain-containing protein [Anaeropeptidivorans aminofermentans]|uniref:cupin domain-containing protein n=1 Tax=Anaeropeptidivorans aminofermentans TaxID=2934315 RepID=UPI002023F1C1|nr:cupin domain-containing protein [Anaeropeptidivorans aminofermentans]